MGNAFATKQLPLSNHFQVHSKNGGTIDSNMLVEQPLVETGMLSSSNEEIINTNVNGGISNSSQEVDLPQPVVTEITNENEPLFQESRKRKRNLHDTLNLILESNNGPKDKYSVKSSASPSSGTSMVTVLKFQNGEFVEAAASVPNYNSPMSLKEMRQAIAASLESCLSQPPNDLPYRKASPRSQSASPKSPKTPSLPKTPSPPQATSPPKEKNYSRKTEAPSPPQTTTPQPSSPPQQLAATTEPVKIKKEPMPKSVPGRKPKAPDKESIKFANRQKELHKLKQEMKKKMKMEGTNLADIEMLRTNLGSWGRTVGVLCTICCNHVQKSYGCFRRDNAPERLLHLFTPGMNRIKICRRCLPYKKQGNVLETNMEATAENPTSTMMAVPQSTSTVTRCDHDLSTIDSTGLNLTTIDPRVIATTDGPSSSTIPQVPNMTRPQPPSQIVLGESHAGEAMEYIKMLADNLKTTRSLPQSVLPIHSKEHLPNYGSVGLDPQWSTALINQHTAAGAVVNEQPASTIITQVPSGSAINQQIPVAAAVSHQQVPPSIINQQTRPPQANLQSATTGINQGGTTINQPTPPWSPFLVKQIPPNIAAGTTQISVPSLISFNNTQTVQNITTVGTSNVNTIPATIVSAQKNTQMQAPVFLQIQQVRVVKGNDSNSRHRKLELVKIRETNEASTSVQNIVTTCQACCQTAATYHCINKQLSPSHLQNLFSNDNEVLVVCRKCLGVDTKLPEKNDASEKPQNDVDQQNQVVNMDLKGHSGTHEDREVVIVEQAGTLVGDPVDQQGIPMDQQGIPKARQENFVDHQVTLEGQQVILKGQERNPLDQQGNLESQEGNEGTLEDQQRVIVDEIGTHENQQVAPTWKAGDEAWTHGDSKGIDVVNGNKVGDLWICANQLGDTSVQDISTIQDPSGSVGITIDFGNTQGYYRPQGTVGDNGGQQGNQGKVLAVQVIKQDEVCVGVNEQGLLVDTTGLPVISGDDEGLVKDNDGSVGLGGDNIEVEGSSSVNQGSREVQVTVLIKEGGSSEESGSQEHNSLMDVDKGMCREDNGSGEIDGCVETGKNEGVAQKEGFVTTVEKLGEMEVEKEQDGGRVTGNEIELSNEKNKEKGVKTNEEELRNKDEVEKGDEKKSENKDGIEEKRETTKKRKVPKGSPSPELGVSPKKTPRAKRNTVKTSKVAAKCHNTRRAVLKTQKKEENLKETSQGVKRKRGRKAKSEESSGNEEPKTTKQETGKESKASPLKKAKTKKE